MAVHFCCVRSVFSSRCYGQRCQKPHRVLSVIIARGGTRWRVTCPPDQSASFCFVSRSNRDVLGCPAAWLWELGGKGSRTFVEMFEFFETGCLRIVKFDTERMRLCEEGKFKKFLDNQATPFYPWVGCSFVWMWAQRDYFREILLMFIFPVILNSHWLIKSVVRAVLVCLVSWDQSFTPPGSLWATLLNPTPQIIYVPSSLWRQGPHWPDPYDYGNPGVIVKQVSMILAADTVQIFLSHLHVMTLAETHTWALHVKIWGGHDNRAHRCSCIQGLRAEVRMCSLS